MENSELISRYNEEFSTLRKEQSFSIDRTCSFLDMENVLFRLKKKITDLSLKDQVEPEIYRDRLQTMIEFLSDFSYALNPELYRKEVSLTETDEEVRYPSRNVWHHRNIANMRELIKEDKGTVNPDFLDSCLSTYLQNEWLKDDWIDWVFLDAYVWYEIAASTEQLASAYPGGWPKWSWLIAGSNSTKAYLIRKGSIFAGLVFRYVIPTAILITLWNRTSIEWIWGSWSTPLEWATKMYLIYLVIRLVTFPLRIRARRRIKKEEAPIERGIEMLGEIYWALGGPPISLENLRSYVYKARDESAILRSGTYSLLDDLAAREKIALTWD